jgi:hypothetical protein
VLLALALGSCGGNVAFSSEQELAAETLPEPTLVALLQASVVAPYSTRYSGVRRLEALVSSLEPGAPSPETLAYRELVAADGGGNFALETLELLSFVPDPPLFEALQETRAGHNYRYRDFAVRDLAALLENYQVRDLDTESSVAGRACRSLELSRQDGSGSLYRVDLDAETGLVLRSCELDPTGMVLARMEFESYDADPDLGSVAWFVPAEEERALDAAAPLAPQAGFEVLEPTQAPRGYRRFKAALLADHAGSRWIKQAFTDGVEPLFFLHQESAEAVQAEAAVAPAPGFGLDAGAVAEGGSEGADELWVYPIGRLTAVQGRLREREVIALGKLDSEALLDLLELSVR